MFQNLLFTAQFELGRFHHVNNWQGCKICLDLLIRSLFVSLSPKHRFGLKISLLDVCCRVKFISLKKDKS